jgi:hypothetical protein
MKSFALIRGNVVAAFVAAGLLSGPLLDFLWFSAFAQPAAPPATSPSATPGATAPQSAHDLKSWRETMSRTPGPKKGCFTSSYPSTEWVEIPCTAAPLHPHQPAYGPGPNIVGGNANDFTALVLPRHISWAVGSFDKVTGVMSAKDDKLGDNFFRFRSTRTRLQRRVANSPQIQIVKAFSNLCMNTVRSPAKSTSSTG